MANKLTPKFYQELSKMCSNLNMSPADMLLIMYLESRLDPTVSTNNSAGLTQFIPGILKKYYSGTPEQFRQLSAEEQLPYIEKFFQESLKPLAGKKANSTQFYIGNILPAKLNDPQVINNDRNAVLAKEGDPTTYSPGGLSYGKAYSKNSGLDFNKDGTITYGDIQDYLNKLSKETGYQTALKELEQSTGESHQPSASLEEKSTPSTVSDMIQHIEQYTKDIEASLSNPVLIKISSSCLENNLEFARILSTACEDLISAKCRTYAGKNNVEILCKSSFDQEEAVPAIKQFSDQLAKQFIKINNLPLLNIQVTANKSPSYQHLSLKTAEDNYRKFMLKRIGISNG